MTYQQEMAKIEADTRRIREAGEELKAGALCICNELPHHHECPRAQDTYNPDIHAATQTVVSPAPDGVVDWRRIGEMLDSKWA